MDEELEAILAIYSEDIVRCAIKSRHGFSTTPKLQEFDASDSDMISIRVERNSNTSKNLRSLIVTFFLKVGYPSTPANAVISFIYETSKFEGCHDTEHSGVFIQDALFESQARATADRLLEVYSNENFCRSFPAHTT